MARLATALLMILAIGCASPTGADGADGQPGASASSSGWVSLFDGETLDGWHGYNREDVPGGWSVDEGTLHFTPGGDGGDLLTDASYDDFELELEWKVAECGNSGIFYTVEEIPALRAAWMTGLEMQVLDNTCHGDAKYPSHRAGALYDLYVPTAEVARPGGEWNQVRIVFSNGQIEHWLNGRKIVEADMNSTDWTARVAASKFRDEDDFPAYGTRRSGRIGVQDHGDPVWYRNIRVRRL
ncbi:MAG: DUF1080 domain-containing protein [Bacteroidota bacterium]